VSQVISRGRGQATNSRSPAAMVSSRMRLAQTQEVLVFAEMSDGAVYTAKRSVKVTVGGCGG
jgi:sulfur-oxidizing protein SoxY